MTGPGESRRERIAAAGVAAFLLILSATSLSGCAANRNDTERAAEAVQRGLVAYADGRIADAEQEFWDALAHDPQNKWARYDLGTIEQARGNLDIAEDHYRQALAIDADFGPALFNLAIIRYDAGAYQEAATLYRHLIEVEPDNAKAHLNLGFTYRALGQEDEAQLEFARAGQIDPTIGIPSAPAPTVAASTATP